MPPEENNIFEEFIRREIQTMEIFLLAKASRTSVTIEEYINTRLLQGASSDSIEKDLIEDLENGGRIFSEFTSSIRSTVNGSISRSRDSAMFSDENVEEQYVWVAVLINTCPDCIARHGINKTYAQWEAEGLPRTGITVCKENCKCVLLPLKGTDIEPINRKRE